MLTKHKPLCWQCGLEMRPEKNGVAVIEMASFGPAAIYMADLWRCSECSIQVIAGLSNNPIAEHYEAGFAAALERAEADEWSCRVWINQREKSQGVCAQPKGASHAILRQPALRE